MGYSFQNGTYIKVGNLVTVGCNMATSSVSGGSGSLRIAGLPFVVGDAIEWSASLGFVYNWAATPPQVGRPKQSTTQMLLASSTGTSSTTAVSSLGAASSFYFTASYSI